MIRNRIFRGLMIGLFATMSLVPVSLTAQGACIAAWETDPAVTHERAELQAQGQVFLPDCGPACEQAVTNALASYERAVLQASGQIFNDVSIAQQQRFARAEMQAQGQRFVETQTFACGGGESVPA